jgi:hypothetical protein
MNESWFQIISLFLANAGLIIWFRSESRADWRHMDNKMDKYREETQVLIRSIEKEMKDFHNQLIEIKHKSSQ